MGDGGFFETREIAAIPMVRVARPQGVSSGSVLLAGTLIELHAGDIRSDQISPAITHIGVGPDRWQLRIRVHRVLGETQTEHMQVLLARLQLASPRPPVSSLCKAAEPQTMDQRRDRTVVVLECRHSDA